MVNSFNDDENAKFFKRMKSDTFIELLRRGVKRLCFTRVCFATWSHATPERTSTVFHRSRFSDPVEKTEWKEPNPSDLAAIRVEKKHGRFARTKFSHLRRRLSRERLWHKPCHYVRKVFREKSLTREKQKKREGEFRVKVMRRGLVLLKDRSGNRADSDICGTRETLKNAAST